MHKLFVNPMMKRAAVSLAALTLAFPLLELLEFHGPARAADATLLRSGDPRSIALVDQRGAPFALRDLRGAPVIVTFVATRCRDACPIANKLFARLRSRLDHDHTVATLLTVTLDPAYDTPFVMAREARVFAARSPGWRFATGVPNSVNTLMRAFDVVTRPDENGVPDVHSTFVYVIDAHGRLARTLLLSTTLVDEAADALRDPALRSV